MTAPSVKSSDAFDVAGPLARLVAVLDQIGSATIAVSGGVDSMTLAAVAHTHASSPAVLVHAVSPAVPASATARVRDHASRSGYNLRVVDAGEFSDPRYRANPVNRCYFCKSNLYSTLVALHEGTVLSGTNTDDLGDYRPGLIAASEQRVRHPYVEADIDKSTVRAIARHLGLDDIADLPSAPCLASRITTGLRVEAEDLKLIDRIEMSLRARLPTASDIRCRKSYTGWIVQLDQQTLSAVGGGNIETLVTEVFAGTGMASGDRVRITAYERGSAFVHAGSSEHDADAAELP